MSNVNQIPLRTNQNSCSNFRHSVTDGLMLNSNNATVNTSSPSINISLLASTPSADAGNGPFTGFSNSAMNAENTVYAGLKDLFSTDCGSNPFSLPFIIPSMSVPTSRNLESAPEQAAVAKNISLSQYSEFDNRLVPENVSGLHALHASQELWMSQQDSAPLATTANATNYSSHDFGVSTPINQRRAKSGTVQPPQQSSGIVPQIHEILAVLPQQRLAMGADKQTNLDEELQSNLVPIIKETGTCTKKRAHDVIRAVENYVDSGSELHKDKLSRIHEAKLESGDKKTRKTAQSNINQQVLRRKRYLTKHASTMAVELIFVDKEEMRTENLRRTQMLEAQNQSLMAEVQRLRRLLSGSSSMRPPHDDPPSGGPPPKDDGQDDDDDDDGWDSGRPGLRFPSSTDGLAFYTNSSSNRYYPYESALVLTGASEDFPDSSSDEISSSEESDSDEESSAVMYSSAIRTEHQSVEDLSYGVNWRQKNDEQSLTEGRMPDPRSMNEGCTQQFVSCSAVPSELGHGAEDLLIPSPFVMYFGAQDTGENGKSEQSWVDGLDFTLTEMSREDEQISELCLASNASLNRSSTPEATFFPNNFFTTSLRRRSGSPPPDDDIPVLRLPPSSTPEATFSGTYYFTSISPLRSRSPPPNDDIPVLILPPSYAALSVSNRQLERRRNRQIRNSSNNTLGYTERASQGYARESSSDTDRADQL